MSKTAGYLLLIVLLCLLAVPVLAIRDKDQPQMAQITFVSNLDGNSEIYVMDADGANLEQITFNTHYKINPFWHPDGTLLGYSTQVQDVYSLYTVDTANSNSTHEKIVLDGTGNVYHAVWSNDGTRLLYHADFDGPQSIYIDSGGESVKLTAASNNYTPEWSPDESQIVFMSDRTSIPTIYLMNADGSDQRPVVGTDLAQYQPDWSPDGTQIVFALVVNGEDWNIAIVDIDGQNLRIFEHPGFDYSPAWSPDGSQIVFQSVLGDEDSEIFIMNADGSNVVQLTDNDVEDTFPIWKSIP